MPASLSDQPSRASSPASSSDGSPVHSLALGIVFGLAVGLLLAFIIAQMQHGYYLQIMLPGGMVGLIVGYATQRYGRGSQLQRT
ncbi:MAG TPA: hypothetical protein VFE61_17975 [Candidatus Sulfotelmatobacter sp.]|nr:hypothetical protein [Candidatus Sulfotelmatobacter sp.]